MEIQGASTIVKVTLVLLAICWFLGAILYEGELINTILMDLCGVIAFGLSGVIDVMERMER